jgi:hypothetical protein
MSLHHEEMIAKIETLIKAKTKLLKDIANDHPKHIFCDDWEIKVECTIGAGYSLSYVWRSQPSLKFQTTKDLFLLHDMIDGGDCGLELLGWKAPGMLAFKVWGDYNNYNLSDDFDEIDNEILFDCNTQTFTPSLYDV